MSILLNSGRQWPLAIEFDILFSDVGSGVDELQTGVAIKIADLPVGALVTNGSLVILTEWNSATSDTMSIGTSGSAVRYLAATDINTGAADPYVPVIPTEFIVTGDDGVFITWTGVGALPTAGKVKIYIEYIIEGRGNEVQT